MSKKKRPSRDSGVIDLASRRKQDRPRLVTKERAIKTAVCVASGVLLFLSCADFDIWPLTWVAVAPLLAVVLHPTTTRPAYYGFVTGLFANGGGFYWIVPFLQRFGHLPLIAAIPIFLLLVGYQALIFTAFAWCVRRLADQLPRLSLILIAPVVYVTFELVVPLVFPWYLAITQAWVPANTQVAELTGPLGVSFLIILSNAAVYEGVRAWRHKEPLPLRRLAVAIGVLAAALAYGQVRIHQVDAARARAPKLKLGLVQANIGIHEKWRPELAYQQLSLHQRLSHQLELKGAELIVWPESSYPHYFYRDQTQDWPDNDLRRARRGFGTPLLFGSLTVGTATKYPYNSALLLDKDGDVRGTFDKNILMVFGEYIPYYEQLKFIKQWIPETSNWARGTDVSIFTLERPAAAGGPVRIGPMICYEDIFPAFGRRLTKREPNLLVNITNDAWFGRTSEPHEHMALAVYRAIEARLDLVRVVNTGVSSFIDATGRVRQKSASVDPDETPGVEPITLLDDVAVMQPVKIYATLGEWFGGLCLAGALVLGLLARARGGRPVRWRLVLAGSGALVLGIIVGGAVFCGPGHLGIVWQILTHRAVNADADLGFRVGLGLLPAVTLACLAAGALVARQAQHDKRDPRPARLESALAVLLVLVAPATLLGSLEGEQAGLVISAMLAIAVALGGARLYRRLGRGAGPGRGKVPPTAA